MVRAKLTLAKEYEQLLVAMIPGISRNFLGGELLRKQISFVGGAELHLADVAGGKSLREPLEISRRCLKSSHHIFDAQLGRRAQRENFRSGFRGFREKAATLWIFFGREIRAECKRAPISPQGLE